MSVEKTILVYKFDELSEKAQEMAMFWGRVSLGGRIRTQDEEDKILQDIKSALYSKSGSRFREEILK